MYQNSENPNAQKPEVINAESAGSVEAVNNSSNSIKAHSKKKLVIAGIALLLLVVILSAVFVLFSNSQKPTNNSSSLTPKTAYQIVNANKELNNEEVRGITEEIINYIRSQRRSDGYYNYISHFDELCPQSVSEEACPFGKNNMFETTNAWGAIGFFSASKILGDKSLLTESLFDLKKLETYCRKDRSQCNRVLIQPALIYSETKDSELLKFLDLQSTALLSAQPPKNPMLSSIEARSSLYLNTIKSNPLHLTSAKTRLDSASKELQQIQQNIYFSSDTPFRLGSCWLALGSIEYAKQTDKNFANIGAFLNNGKISENFSQIMVPSEIQPCIESYIMLYKSTNDISYLDKAKQLMELFIDAFYDGQKSKKIYGEGGTKFANAGVDERTKGIVTLTDSAYTLYLLSLLYEI